MAERDKLERLLGSFDNESGAAPYARKLEAMLGDVDLKKDRVSGLALMALLEIADISLPSGEPLEDPSAFSPNLQMIASVPTVYLEDVNRDAYWWRFQYLGWADEQEQRDSVRALVERLKAVGAVQSVAGFSFLESQ